MREIIAPVAAFFVVLLVVVGIAFGVAQAAPHVSYAEAKASPYTVIFERADGFSAREATFVDSDRQPEKLHICEAPRLFEKGKCVSEDGNVVVRYGIYKSRLRHVTVEVDGKLHELHCVHVSDGKNSRTRACMPND